MKINTDFNFAPKTGPATFITGGILLILASLVISHWTQNWWIGAVLGTVCIVLGFILSLIWANVYSKKYSPSLPMKSHNVNPFLLKRPKKKKKV